MVLKPVLILNALRSAVLTRNSRVGALGGLRKIALFGSFARCYGLEDVLCSPPTRSNSSKRQLEKPLEPFVDFPQATLDLGDFISLWREDRKHHLPSCFLKRH